MSMKKRWYGDKAGGGVKTALGVKRNPNRKDRERARAKFGLVGGGGSSFDAGVASPVAKKLSAPARAKKKSPQHWPGKGASAGLGRGESGVGLKRKVDNTKNASSAWDDKHKKRRVEEVRAAAPREPVAVQRYPPSEPKTEKGQKLQELLRMKLAKANALKGNSGAHTVEPVPEKEPSAHAHTGKHAGVNEGSARTPRTQESEATDEVKSVKVVQGKLAAGKVSCNWLSLKQDMKRDKKMEKRGKKPGGADADKLSWTPGAHLPTPLQLINCVGPLGVDCEMVGVGEGGHRSVLARVSIVDYNGDVAPQEKVTDYRTRVSGVRPCDVKGAPSFQEVQNLVSISTKNKVIVGHSLQHDLKALMLTHEKKLIRDTAKYRPYQNAAKKPRKLRDLAKELLGMDIQGGEHSSVEDARATLLLYKLASSAWEKEIAAKAAKLEKGKKKKGAPPAIKR